MMIASIKNTKKQQKVAVNLVFDDVVRKHIATILCFQTHDSNIKFFSQEDHFLGHCCCRCCCCGDGGVGKPVFVIIRRGEAVEEDEKNNKSNRYLFFFFFLSYFISPNVRSSSSVHRAPHQVR